MYDCVPRKHEEALSQNPNANIRHLLDSLVSALAVCTTAFRSKLFLNTLQHTATPESRRQQLQKMLHSVDVLFIFLLFFQLPQILGHTKACHVMQRQVCIQILLDLTSIVFMNTIENKVPESTVDV